MIHQLPKGMTMITTPNNFDLFSAIENLPQDYVRSRVAESIAWNVDRMLSSCVRQVYRELADTIVDEHVESVHDRIIDIVNGQDLGDFWLSAGGMDEGPLRRFHMLLDLRLEIHELAATAAAMVIEWNDKPRNYVIPDLDSIFDPSKKRDASASAKAKMRRRAQTVAATRASTPEEEAALAQRMYDRKLKRARAKAEDMAEAMLTKKPSLIALMTEMSRHRPHGIKDNYNFVDLPFEIRRELMEMAEEAAERAISWAEDDRNIDDDEFDDIQMAADLFTGKLQQVLRPKITPKIEISKPAVSAAAAIKNAEPTSTAVGQALKDAVST